MDSATTIAQGIHATDGKSAYDRACKRLLSQKIILAWILQSCVEEFRDLDVNDIAEKYIEGTPTVGQEPVLPDEKGTLIQGMDIEDSSPWREPSPMTSSFGPSPQSPGNSSSCISI